LLQRGWRGQKVEGSGTSQANGKGKTEKDSAQTDPGVPGLRERTYNSQNPAGKSRQNIRGKGTSPSRPGATQLFVKEELKKGGKTRQKTQSSKKGRLEGKTHRGSTETVSSGRVWGCSWGKPGANPLRDWKNLLNQKGVHVRFNRHQSSFGQKWKGKKDRTSPVSGGRKVRRSLRVASTGHQRTKREAQRKIGSGVSWGGHKKKDRKTIKATVPRGLPGSSGSYETLKEKKKVIPFRPPKRDTGGKGQPEEKEKVGKGIRVYWAVRANHC